LRQPPAAAASVDDQSAGCAVLLEEAENGVLHLKVERMNELGRAVEFLGQIGLIPAVLCHAKFLRGAGHRLAREVRAMRGKFLRQAAHAFLDGNAWNIPEIASRGGNVKVMRSA